MKLSDSIARALAKAAVALPKDVEAVIAEATEREREAAVDAAGKAGLSVLEAIGKNLAIAGKTGLPMCQDTGMFDVFIDLGRSCPVAPARIEAAVSEGCAKAVEKASYRRSVVREPVFSRKNTKTNLPPIINWRLVDGDGFSIAILLKGFGSENCCSLRMLNPTGGPDAVVAAVTEIVEKAGGKPCPPIFLGVGIGGTMERAALLSKIALLRDVGIPHCDSAYAGLEQRIFDAVQDLHIGPGGLGGETTVLNVAIEHEPTHIAGLPVAVSINCWADRKAKIVWEGEDV